MCQAYEGERAYLQARDSEEAQRVLKEFKEREHRLSRYDEAVRLLDEAQWELDGEHSPETVKRIEAFLASESQEEEGGR